MFKRHTFWLWTTVVFQLLTAAIHSTSFFVASVPQNETERQLIELMNTYRQDLGAGFQPSTREILTALSSCFTLVYLLGGLSNAFLLRKRAAADILKGIVGINVLIFGACFVIMFFYTFLPPIILTGLVFLFLIVSYFLIQRAPTPESRQV